MLAAVYRLVMHHHVLGVGRIVVGPVVDFDVEPDAGLGAEFEFFRHILHRIHHGRIPHILRCRRVY